MNKKTYDRGFTVKRATEQIHKREDNTYNKKTIEKVLKMYAEECMQTLINGGKINIKCVGTIRPNIIHSVHCGLPLRPGYLVFFKPFSNDRSDYNARDVIVIDSTESSKSKN
ncbi:hypothetical protein BN3590_00732 [Clostridium sp. C105KSO15]|nr:hypothetical protein BN3590_00732 [Clostridium sp. C105KSO15]